MTHKELVELSRKWLISKGYPIVVTEIACVGEEPDAIGFKNGSSVMIECKVSRNDFLSDKKKPWRLLADTALGQERYYCAPENLIKPEELPSRWGLIQVRNNRLEVKVKPEFFPGKNFRNELYILMSIIRRIGHQHEKIDGVNIRCYTHDMYSTKNRATVSIGRF